MRIPPSLLAALAALVLAGSSCGTEGSGTGSAAPSSSRSATAASRPAQVPAAPGEVTTRYPVTVLDDGDGAELCLGGVADSLPPQCGGPPLLGWRWADHAGDFESRSGVRWGDFLVTGTFDGVSVTPTKVVAAADADEPESPVADDEFATPCPDPAGGWRVVEPALTTDVSLQATMARAEQLDGYAESWLDQSINPASDDPTSAAEGALNDPTKLIVNVRVTRDPDHAEAELRRGWGGALCVSLAQHTDQELRGIQADLDELPGILSSAPGRDDVELAVVYDDGSYQAWADATYGAGTVVVTPALVDVAD